MSRKVISYNATPRPLTWSCPRCGRPFVTEIQRDLHYLSCGK